MLVLLTGWLLLSGVTCDRDRTRAVRQVNKGLKQYQAGDVQAAIQLLEDAAKTDPDFAKPRYQLGQMQEFDLGNRDKAEQLYREALEIDEQPKHHYALARVLESRGKHGEAIGQLRTIVEGNESHARAWFRLGNNQEAMGRHPEAIDSYMRSIRARPRMSIGDDSRRGVAYHALGDLYIRFGFYDKALKAYDNGIDNNPEVARLHRGRGLAQLRLERYEKAAGSFERALKRDSDAATAYFNLAVARRGMGHLDAALRALEKFIKVADRSGNRARMIAARKMIRELDNTEETP